MKWINEPVEWSASGTDVNVATEGVTDFWRITGEGVSALRDNGHLYGETMTGDFNLSVDIRGDFREQYDQAGVMVRVNDRQWFKTGVEYFDGKPRFSTVVTFDYSNWMLTDLPEPLDELSIRLAYRGDAVEVRRSLNGGPFEFSAHLYLPPGGTYFAGVMCASPKGDGFDVTFRNFVLASIDTPSLGNPHFGPQP